MSGDTGAAARFSDILDVIASRLVADLRMSEFLSKQRFDGVDVESAAVCALRHFRLLFSPLHGMPVAGGFVRALAKNARLDIARARAQTERIIAPF